MIPQTSGYDPIPDVEVAEEREATITSTLSAKEKYPGFDDNQVDLLSTLDTSISSSSQLNSKLPDVNPDEIASKGQAFVEGLLAPTVTAVCSTIAAMLLAASAKASVGTTSISSLLIQFFPYINATVVFMSSFAPIQKRLMAAIEPVFEKMDKLQDIAINQVRDIATSVDVTLDSIQEKLHKSLEPIMPTLDMATQQEAALQRIRPGIDIPDPTDIDREFDQAQGIVRRKIDEAEAYIHMDKCLPEPFQSADSFYRRIVFPIAIVALLIQLGLAFVTAAEHGATVAVVQGFNVSDPNLTQFGGAALRGTNMTDYGNEITGRMNGRGGPRSVLGDTLEEVQRLDLPQLDGFGDVNMHTEALGEATDYKNNVGERAQGIDGVNFNNTLEGANLTEFKVNLRERAHQYEDDFEATVGKSKSMLKSVAISYVIAFLQLALVYVMTNEKIKA